jgi:protocatechuate 3,4-dioxygenase beta subunit
MNALLYLILLLTPWAYTQRDPVIGGPCEMCDLMFTGMPANISWDTRIDPVGEKGEPLVISGRILKADGRTPAPGIILYVYHTDASGEYSPAAGHENRHGHLRGWMKTDAQGRYRFTTIRPASYPQGRNPQHIHPIINEPGKGYYWVDEYLFDDDPYLTERERSSQDGRGGVGIIHLTKDNKGMWTGTRDIVLGKNVPGYK